MRPELRFVGNCKQPLVVIDEFLGDLGPVLAAARALAPYPQEAGSYYPGVRREIVPEDGPANDYVTDVMAKVGRFLGGAYDIDSYRLLRASFSIVTSQPDQLQPMQRAPHFDSPDADYVAMIHYLSVPPDTGTAFFRQRSTGIECVDDRNMDRFVTTARVDSAWLGPDDGYIQGDNHSFEEIGRVGAVNDRLVFYRGGLLHSGIIPPDMVLDANPARGRLTANFFLMLDRGA